MTSPSYLFGEHIALYDEGDPLFRSRRSTRRSPWAGAAGVVLALAMVVASPGVASAMSGSGVPVDPTEIMPYQRMALPDLPCDPAGPSGADAEAATQLNGMLVAKMKGAVTPEIAACARVVIQAVKDRGLNQRAGTIAIATSIVEASIRNVQGGDRDSTGLFQQRASWGSMEARNNPVTSTNLFLDAMERIYSGGSWNTAPIGDVAADVQRPAEPYRGRYAVEAGDATTIVTTLWGSGGGTPVKSGDVVHSRDYNGDGKADLIGQHTDGVLFAFRATGSMDEDQFGNGVEVGNGWTTESTPRILTGNFTGDKKADLIAVHADGALKAFRSSGTYTKNELFTDGAGVGWGWSTASTPRIVIGDFDGDGTDDIIGQHADGVLRAFHSTGSMDDDQFGYGIDAGNGWKTDAVDRILVGDFNGDKKDDLLAVGTDGILRVFAATGTFQDNQLFTAGVEVGWGWTAGAMPRILVGDFDGDGTDDIIGQTGDGGLRAFTGSGSMDADQFGDGVTVGRGWQASTVERILVGDYNGDGKDDIMSGQADGALKAFPSSGTIDNFTLFGSGVGVGWGWTTATTPRVL